MESLYTTRFKGSSSQWWSQNIFSEIETLAKTEVSRHETSQDISDLGETRREWEQVTCNIVKMFKTWDTAETQVSRYETSQDNLTFDTPSESKQLSTRPSFIIKNWQQTSHKAVVLKPYVSWAKYTLS